MIKFAETYFRLDISLDRGGKTKLQNVLLEIARQKAQGKFGEVEVAVYIEDGSIKGWIPYAKALAAIVIAYGGLRDGIEFAIKDGRWLSNQMIEVIQNSGISNDQVLRTERRSGTAGRLKRLLKRIDQFESQNQNLRRDERDIQIHQIQRQLLEILRSTDGEEDRSIVLKNIPGDIQKGLPSNLPKPAGLPQLPVALRPEEFEYEGPRYLPTNSSRDLVLSTTPHISPKIPTHQVVQSDTGFKFIPN